MKNSRWIASVLSLYALLWIPACAEKKPPESAPPVPQVAVPEVKKGGQGEVYVGLASYYGLELSGQQTASNSTYDPNKLTAAHRTLPLGTRVRVTNLENNRSVIVIISDRGPSRADRMIDLSLAAARELNMIGSGVVKVRVEVLYE